MKQLPKLHLANTMGTIFPQVTDIEDPKTMCAPLAIANFLEAQIVFDAYEPLARPCKI